MQQHLHHIYINGLPTIILQFVRAYIYIYTYLVYIRVSSLISLIYESVQGQILDFITKFAS